MGRHDPEIEEHHKERTGEHTMSKLDLLIIILFGGTALGLALTFLLMWMLGHGEQE